MCGLVGIASDLITSKHMDMMKDMLVFSSVRGAHSTGIGVVSKAFNKEEIFFDIAKSPGNPYVLLDQKKYEKVAGTVGKRVVIGHNRFATIGSINEANAHPFETVGGNILGAHNGTIRNGLYNEKDFGTDSEAIYNAFDAIGIENVIPNLTGAWALTWYDHRNETINFLRNKERSLYFAWTKDNQTLFWASEYPMIYAAADRHGIGIEQPVAFAVDTLYSFQILSGTKWKDTLEKKPMAGKEVVVHSHVPFQQTRTTSGTNTSTSNSGGTTQGTQTNSKASESAFEKAKEGGSAVVNHTESFQRYRELRSQAAVVPATNGTVQTTNGNEEKLDQEYRKGFNGEMISKLKFKYILDKGCSWCSSTIHKGEKFRFVASEEVLCEACMDNDSLVEMFGIVIGKKNLGFIN